MKRLLVLAVALCAGTAPLAALAQVERPSYEKPLSTEAARDVQARLRALGYYGGPIDGMWGHGTQASLERFQRDRHLAATGRLNQATVTAMGLDPERRRCRSVYAAPDITAARSTACGAPARASRWSASSATGACR